MLGFIGMSFVLLMVRYSPDIVTNRVQVFFVACWVLLDVVSCARVLWLMFIVSVYWLFITLDFKTQHLHRDPFSTLSVWTVSNTCSVFHFAFGFCVIASEC